MNMNADHGVHSQGVILRCALLSLFIRAFHVFIAAELNKTVHHYNKFAVIKSAVKVFNKQVLFAGISMLHSSRPRALRGSCFVLCAFAL